MLNHVSQSEARLPCLYRLLGSYHAILLLPLALHPLHPIPRWYHIHPSLPTYEILFDLFESPEVLTLRQICGIVVLRRRQVYWAMLKVSDCLTIVSVVMHVLNSLEMREPLSLGGEVMVAPSED